MRSIRMLVIKQSEIIGRIVQTQNSVITLESESLEFISRYKMPKPKPEINRKSCVESYIIYLPWNFISD